MPYVLRRHSPGISINYDGRHVVTTISFSKRVEKLFPVMIKISFFELDEVFNSENIPHRALSEKLMSIWALIWFSNISDISGQSK